MVYIFSVLFMRRVYEYMCWNIKMYLLSVIGFSRLILYYKILINECILFNL